MPWWSVKPDAAAFHALNCSILSPEMQSLYTVPGNRNPDAFKFASEKFKIQDSIPIVKFF